MNERELNRRLRAIREPAPPAGLGVRLEQGIPASLRQSENIGEPRRWTMARLGGAMAMTVATLLVVVWVGMLIGPAITAPAYAAMLDRVVEATDRSPAVHVVLNVLTREGEDFSFVNLDGKLRPVEAWFEWPQLPGDPARARIDKADRIYSFDGRETLWYHPKRGEAFRGEGRRLDTELFWPAAWVRQIRARPHGDVEVLEQEEGQGYGRIVLREAGVDVSPLEKSFLGEFDRESEVIWDTATHRLTGLRRWVLVDGERRLFAELVSIDYLPAVSDELFRIDLPQDVRWGGVRPGSPELLELGPREIAVRLFEAALRNEREELGLYCPSPSMVDWLLDDRHRPSEILYIGDPFRAGDYPGVFVPYAVRFGPDGIKEFNLALRNDNDEHRWVFDGGI